MFSSEMRVGLREALDGLAHALAVLAAVDLTAEDDRVALDATVEQQRLANRLAAEQVRLIGHVDGRGGVPVGRGGDDGVVVPRSDPGRPR